MARLLIAEGGQHVSHQQGHEGNVEGDSDGTVGHAHHSLYSRSRRRSSSPLMAQISSNMSRVRW
jgi:hypothetical protein